MNFVSVFFFFFFFFSYSFFLFSPVCLSLSLFLTCLSVCLSLSCLSLSVSVSLSVCLCLSLSLSYLLGQIPKFQPFFLYLSVRQKTFWGWSGVGRGGGVISKSLNRIYETLSYNPNKLIQPSEQALHSKQAGTSV